MFFYFSCSLIYFLHFFARHFYLKIIKLLRMIEILIVRKEVTRRPYPSSFKIASTLSHEKKSQRIESWICALVFFFYNNRFVHRTFVKFIYSEKATKFFEISTNNWLAVSTNNWWRFRKILKSSQNIWTLSCGER